jgi:hypothetical protein
MDWHCCPSCGSETFAFLKQWVKPATPPNANPGAAPTVAAGERAEHVNTYRQLLEPERRPSRKERLIAHGALGLAILGAARLAWASVMPSKRSSRYTIRR